MDFFLGVQLHFTINQIKWVDKVFYNNEVENVKFLKSGSLAFENREDV